MFKSGFVVDAGDQHAVVVEAIAHADTSKGQMHVLEMGTSGLTTAAVPAAGQIVQACVAQSDITSGDRGIYVIAGTCEILNGEATTAGQGIEIDNSLAGAGDSGGAVTTIRGEAQTTCGVWLETEAGTAELTKALLHGGLTTVAT